MTIPQQTFESLLPEAKPLDLITYEQAILIMDEVKDMCVECGRYTYWVDYKLFEYLCSPNCEDSYRKKLSNLKGISKFLFNVRIGLLNILYKIVTFWYKLALDKS